MSDQEQPDRPHPEGLPPVLTAAQVAELLGHAHRLCPQEDPRGRHPPAHRPPGGRVFCYVSDDIIEWL